MGFDRVGMRTFRDNLGMTQHKLAVHLDTREINVSRWETGRSTPSAHNIERLLNLCKEHDVAPSFFPGLRR